MAQMLTTPSLTPFLPASNKELIRLFGGANARNGDSAGVMTGIPHAFLLSLAPLH
ncbi:glutamate synthase (NADPH/NADH) small chain [Puccinia sorghi]|uniref:Glutamate synthase (NADPH/NADH) small chain n=1 Tax=Puccinia sorghi TaxID=27349 RepID=A0A0L6UK83_9BASI|nr:glutamate synthase (NADPH/NADH) small chain [Puccinia sorghi]